jgi:DNA polymerase type B, organellar and viral
MIVKRSTRRFHGDLSRNPDYNPKARALRAPSYEDRTVIAWDMEGLSLSGEGKPQHAVLFGNSTDVRNPLIAWQLSSRRMLEHIIDVGKKNPHAIHVGYGFKYDATMLIGDLSERQIIRLWKSGSVRFRFDAHNLWSIRWVPGKMFTVTKRWGQARDTRAKTSVTIYDYSSFFHEKFLDAAEKILGDALTPEDREVIAHGKAARGKQSWSDMPSIQHYWSREILLIKRVFERFRDVMYQAGFALKQWYGPGALANYLNATHKIIPHLAGAQTTSGVMPREVHEASKIAFSGGRFELFKAGRIRGPVYAADLGSAYPYALTLVPSLHPDEGQWVHVDKPTRIGRFGVYRLRFAAPDARFIEYRPMPLFWRDPRGMVSYPNVAHGWYWSPEADIAQKMGAEVYEGWEWCSNEKIFPWSFLHEMYNTRMRLGKKNLLSLPFKLGPNSLYGKYAQTVGWDTKKKTPPKSHALPVAGWVTSYCRRMLYLAMLNNPHSIVAVETDAIYTTENPEHWENMTFGTGLGEWDVDTYDEMLYVQSGMYHYKKDGEWKGVRSRGMSRAEYPHSIADAYLRSLRAGQDWPAMNIELKPRFVSAGAAIATNCPLHETMRRWIPQQREYTLGQTGKRMHAHRLCPQCHDGVHPYDQPHSMFIASRSDGETLSHPRTVPWEKAHPPEVQTIRDELARERELLA